MKDNKKKMGRPRKGHEVAVKKSLRIEPSTCKQLIKKYGGFQKAFDEMLRKEMLK